MNFLKIINIIIIFIFFQSNYLFSQIVGQDYTKDVLSKEWNVSILLRTNGWGIGYRNGKAKNIFISRFFETELHFVKHDKEIKGRNPYFPNAKQYVYGKLKRLNILHLGYGQTRVLNFKPYWGGTELRYHYFGGFSLALTSPQYLSIIYEDKNYITKIEKYNPDIHYLDNIYGNATLGKGWFELTPNPGLYFKAGLSFEFGTNDRKVQLLEMGAVVDGFPYPIKLMAYNNPQNFFYGFYLSYHFGKRKEIY